jgi:phage-related tail protein
MAWVIIWNKFDYVMKMRSRINKPVCWTDVLNVKISDTRAVVQGAITTDPSVGTITREAAYTYLTPTQTQDTLTISTGRVVPILIDEADRYQQTYVSQMELAEYQGKLLSEYVEAQMLAQHGSFTNFGATDLSNTGDDDTTAITVSASNIDDLIRAIKRKIYANNGVDMAVEKGLFIVWRAGDFEFLEAFVQAKQTLA